MRHLANRAKRLMRGLRGDADPVILMYHRVARVTPDPWGLAVSPDRFAAQMRELKRTRKPVPLDQMVAQMRAGQLQCGTVAITFDDAYRDVLLNAKPILAELDIPATVFVVTGELGNQRGFWWDVLGGAVFTGDPPIDPPTFSFMDEEGHRAIAENWRNDDRSALHHSFWSVIRLLSPDMRETAIEEVVASFGAGRAVDAPVMTADELSLLMEGGLISIGAHSVSHPSLPGLSALEQREEIAQSRDALEGITSMPIRSLAYPFGEYDDHSLEIALELGFDYAVSVATGSVGDAAMRFQLPRHDVKNWTGPEFRKRLRWWI